MTTITPTQARVNLSSVLRRALKGDDIGIVVAGQIVALRPVEILSRDYAEREYGLNRTEMKAIARKLHAKAQKARRTGKSKIFKGDIEALLKD
jgi:antitoxin (DNA-binding transcriptional repressor) of toxin-antitoxin stability system